MVFRKKYEEELQALNNKIIEMGQITERLIDQTIKAVILDDDELARKTIQEDDIIDNMQIEVEKQCALIIALQQPVAGDLRFVISTVKIVTDIERIADQCSDICQYSIRLNDGSWSRDVNYQRHIEKMALSAKEMLEKTISSYITKDMTVIREICKSDDKIDAIFHKVWKEITEEMMANRDFIRNGVHYIMIIKYLERIADHITNIAEWILYSNTGEYFIHQTIED